MRSASVEISASVGIAVDIDRGVLLKFLPVVFGPFRGTEQHGLFAVPCAVNDSALRLPALLEQQGESTRFFQQRNLSRNGIFGAVHPRIVMVAPNNPGVWLGSSGNLEDDVVDRLDVPVRCHAQMNLRRTGTDVVGQR